MADRTSGEPSEQKYRQYRTLCEQLPFARKDAKGNLVWWSLPQTGGYTGGCRTGGPAAKAFMRFLRDCPDEIASGQLWFVIESMLFRGRRPPSDALAGQAMSFFNTLQSVLHAAAKLDGALDLWTYKHCGELIEEGLQFDEQSWIDSLERERRSKASKLAHERKRDAKARVATGQRGRCDTPSQRRTVARG